MAVIQAKTWTEFNYVLDTALEVGVTSVALPKLLTKHLGPLARLAGAEIVRDTDDDVPIHCLGCSSRLSEAKDLARQGIVRGIDSAAPVVLGLQGLKIDRGIKYDWEVSHKAFPNYWQTRPTYEAEVNLGIFRQWCEAPPPVGQV
jgi:hypothetical protein